MATKRGKILTDGSPTEVSPDCRYKWRYPIELPVQYKIVQSYLGPEESPPLFLSLSEEAGRYTSLNVPFLKRKIELPVIKDHMWKSKEN
jgi:hypothetical protein